MGPPRSGNYAEVATDNSFRREGSYCPASIIVFAGCRNEGKRIMYLSVRCNCSEAAPSRCDSIKKLPRCCTVEMPYPHSDKSGRLEVHRVHRNSRVAAFLPISIVCDAATFVASIIGANLPVP